MSAPAPLLDMPFDGHRHCLCIRLGKEADDMYRRMRGRIVSELKV
jgi:hypothetical protein